MKLKLATQDTRTKQGQLIPICTGRYPADYTFTVFMPAAWSYEPCYWFQMERYMARYAAHDWWTWSQPGPPAQYRVRVDPAAIPSDLNLAAHLRIDLADLAAMPAVTRERMRDRFETTLRTKQKHSYYLQP